MKISCTNKIDKQLKKHVVNICKFTIDKAFTEKQALKLESLQIKIDNRLANTGSLHAITIGYMDIAYGDDFDYPRDFIIWINPLFISNDNSSMKTSLLETVIHEMIHIRQHVANEFKHVYKKGEMFIKFRNKLYNLADKEIYWLAPWEIEARGYECGILNMYCIENNCCKEFPDKFMS